MIVSIWTPIAAITDIATLTLIPAYRATCLQATAENVAMTNAE
jgi:hypothetical protein